MKEYKNRLRIDPRWNHLSISDRWAIKDDLEFLLRPRRSAAVIALAIAIITIAFYVIGYVVAPLLEMPAARSAGLLAGGFALGGASILSQTLLRVRRWNSMCPWIRSEYHGR